MFRNPLIDGVVILIIVLLILGPKRLPELGKGLGRGMREFKEGISGESDDDRDRSKLNAAASEPAPRPPAEPSSAERRESAEAGPDRKV